MTTDGQSPEELLDLAATAQEEGDDDRAETLARRALETLRAKGGETELVAEALLCLAEIAIDARRDGEAFRLLDEGSALPEVAAEAALLRARLHLLRWETAEAELALDESEQDPQLRPAALYERAILKDLAGEPRAADALYAEAARLDPETFREPVRMTDDEARQLLDEVLQMLPEPVRRALENVAIEIVPMPDLVIDAGHDTDPLLLGVYSGVPLPEKSVDDSGVLPGRIRVFKRNLERIAGFEVRLTEEMRITLLHEIGHHLGWDEEELADRGLD